MKAEEGVIYVEGRRIVQRELDEVYADPKPKKGRGQRKSRRDARGRDRHAFWLTVRPYDLTATWVRLAA